MSSDVKKCQSISTTVVNLQWYYNAKTCFWPSLPSVVHAKTARCQCRTYQKPWIKVTYIYGKRESNVLPEPDCPRGGADLHFLSPQPDISLYCETSDMGLVYRSLHGNPSQSYGASLATWNQTVPIQVNAPRLNPSHRLVVDLPIPEGWKAELTQVAW